MDFNELVASRAELEAAIREIQGKVTGLWRINHQQEEKIKDLEKQNEDQKAKFEVTKHKLTRTEATIRALETKVKLQKANIDDLRKECQQQQDEIKALKTQEKSDQLKYAAKVSELKRENSTQAAKVTELQKAKTCDVTGVKANFSFLQSKLTRAESEYKDKIAELNSKNLKQKEDQESQIETLKDHLEDKENLIGQLLHSSQTKDSSCKTQSHRLALLEIQVENLEADKLRQESRSQELEAKYSVETFRREKLQQRLKLNQYDVDQVHEIAQSLEYHFNSTYVRFSGDNKLHTKAELEEAYMEAQRLQDKRRALALARRMRIQEEEDRDGHAFQEEE
ncbi:hypothetical protein FMUND_631 [Fusarium mundagurra]|uniref:Uncharacterized protein n=1 Tax=Fusarium mundagurra TaxID=1567541 RepID=A0A8H6DP45_9HYPO|nr:hypothetical protein FMUND_631 [Fusarium mundagurra]